MHHFWSQNQGEEIPPLIQPLSIANGEPTLETEGWVSYRNRDNQVKIYPVPGPQINFSLGVVIAQRRIPQSLWHRGLNEAYKKAKERGKNRVCVRVLFNSGQSLEWVCPWPLWNLLMAAELRTQGETELNRWEKLLFYFESVRLRQQNIYAVQELLTILWKSVGLDSLTWDEIEQNSDRQHEEQEIGNWQWWINWISLRAFLARQERDRQNWLQSLENLGRIQP